MFSASLALPVLKKIILIRHGSTKLNGSSSSSHDKIRGWQDVPLDDRGVLEAHKAAKELSKFHATALYSSDLSRASNTAAILAHDAGIPLSPSHITQYFRPWNLGKFNGQESSKAASQIQKYTEQPSVAVPGGESFHDFERRFFRGLKMLCGMPGIPALVTHYRCFCLLDAWAQGGYQPNGSIDHGKFNKHGDAPGHVKEFDVPVERIPS